MNILVLDVGTSSIRGTLMNDMAEVIRQEQIPYRLTYGENGRVEQDPEDWLRALRTVCASVASQNTVEAVAVTSQRSSLIPVDRQGRPVRDAIMWQDTRNAAVCDERKDREEFVRAMAGTGINTVFSGGKMTWFRENEPECYGRTDSFFVVPDYLIFHMTGQKVTDHTYGSRSMLMDIRSRTWSPELLRLFRVEEEKLCRLIPVSSVAGTISPAFAAETGLPAGIAVVSCGGDQQCAALGQGIIQPGEVSVNLGTGAYLVAAIDSVPDRLTRDIICNTSAIPGQYILESSVLTCGAALDWFLPEKDYALVGQALRESPPGANGVMALPYFQGRSAPDWNSRARAAFLGLSLDTNRLDMLRALLEGIFIDIGQSLKRLERVQPICSISLSGGVSRTPETAQLLADVTGKRVYCAQGREATGLGAWMSASHCLGVVPDWQAAWERVRPDDMRAYTPAADLRRLYEKRASQMENYYQTLCVP